MGRPSQHAASAPGCPVNAPPQPSRHGDITFTVPVVYINTPFFSFTLFFSFSLSSWDEGMWHSPHRGGCGFSGLVPDYSRGRVRLFSLSFSLSLSLSLSLCLSPPARPPPFCFSLIFCAPSLFFSLFLI